MFGCSLSLVSNSLSTESNLTPTITIPSSSKRSRPSFCGELDAALRARRKSLVREEQVNVVEVNDDGGRSLEDCHIGHFPVGHFLLKRLRPMIS